MFRAGAVAVSLLMACSLQAQAKGPLQALNVGAWSGGSFVNDDTGAFDHCSATADGRNGDMLLAAVAADGAWRLGVVDPRFDMPPGDDVTTELFFDRDGPYTLTAHTNSTGMLEIPMPASGHMEQTFKDSYSLTVILDGHRLRFSLQSTSDLMDALHGCVTANTQQASAGAPSKDQPPGTPPKPAAASPEVEAVRAKLVSEVETRYSDCVSGQLRDIVPYSNETAEVLSKVISMKCDSIEQHYFDLSMAILNKSRDDVEKNAEAPIEKRKNALVAEIVTMRAAVAKKQADATQQKAENVATQKTP